MALLERVSTLVRANLNDLIDKAEDPEKMIKQVILDMQNQLMQVKTQVAISIADQHVLDKKHQESEENERQWMRRAEMALDKKDDALARAALERSMSYKQMAEGFRQQVEDQKAQVESLKTALLKLQQKLAEAQSKSDLLIAQHRRSRAMRNATAATRVSAGLVRWTIPYRASTFVGTLGNRIAIRVGHEPELLLAPDDPAAFVAEVAKYAPHLQVM